MNIRPGFFWLKLGPLNEFIAYDPYHNLCHLPWDLVELKQTESKGHGWLQSRELRPFKGARTTMLLFFTTFDPVLRDYVTIENSRKPSLVSSNWITRSCM